MKTAQKMMAAWVGLPDHPDADIKVAVEQTREIASGSYAPHKNRGTLPKPKRRASTVLSPRLFKGHRP